MHHFFYLTIIVIVAGVRGANISPESHAEILRYENNIDAEGNYKYAYETSNGIRAQEKGIAGEYVSGGYAYSYPEGELFQLTYLADENGFQPSGSHLPIAPPIPYAILKSLEYIRTHPYYNKT